MQPALFDFPRFRRAIRAKQAPEELSASILYSAFEVEQLVLELIGDCQRLRDRIADSKTIWVKPNLTSAEAPENGRTTHPVVLDSVLRAVQQLFPKKRVIVADSSVIGCDTRAAAKAGGVLEVCRRRLVSFVDLRHTPFEAVHLDGALEFPSLLISAPFLSPNVFKINVAKLKSTYGSPASFAIKNSKGCIPDEFKLRFHLKGLERSLCDLGRGIRWDLVISEAFPSSELGRPGPSGVVIASTSAVACDLAACMALGIPFADAFHVEWLGKYYDFDLAWAAGNPDWDSFVAACPKLRFSRTSLQDLEAAYGICINDGRPCTACLESFAKAVMRTAGHQSIRDVEAILGANVTGSFTRRVCRRIRLVAAGKASEGLGGRYRHAVARVLEARARSRKTACRDDSQHRGPVWERYRLLFRIVPSSDS